MLFYGTFDPLHDFVWPTQKGAMTSLHTSRMRDSPFSSHALNDGILLRFSNAVILGTDQIGDRDVAPSFKVSGRHFLGVHGLYTRTPVSHLIWRQVVIEKISWILRQYGRIALL